MTTSNPAPMVCVPVEPTEAMTTWLAEELQAAESWWIDTMQELWEDGHDVPDEKQYAALWIAERLPDYLAAAPAPPQAVPGEGMCPKGQAFKDYVHQRLDAMGVPHSVPESEHDKAGCRIGGRLDFVEQRIAPAPAPPQAVQGEAVAWRCRHPSVNGGRWSAHDCKPEDAAISFGWEAVPLYTSPAMPIAASGDDLVNMLQAVASDTQEPDRIRRVCQAAAAALRSQGQAVDDATVELAMNASVGGYVVRDCWFAGEKWSRELMRAALTAALAQQANKDAP